MSWWAVDVKSAPAVRDEVAAWLVARTGQAVEERGDGTLVGFAGSEADAGELVRLVREYFGNGVETVSRELE
jgi:hypothetical protein